MEVEKQRMQKLEAAVGCQWIIMGAVWTTFYGYEALGFSKDPDNCYASDFSDLRVTDLHDNETADFVDVGERFDVVFKICYYSSAILLAMGLIHCINVKSIRILTKAIGSCAQ